MAYNNVIITDIKNIKTDTLYPDKPFIPRTPREYHAIAYITEGTLRYKCNGNTVDVLPHEIIFIKSGYIDIAECASDGQTSYISMDFQTLDNDFDLMTRYSQDDILGDLYKLFDKSLQRFIIRGMRWKMDCIECLYSILNHLLKTDKRTNFKFRRIAPAITMLEDKLSDSALSVSDLAKICGISTGSLNRIIRELYGCSTSELISSRRMEHACYLLRNSVNSIGEIALSCGYSDISSFSHAFYRAHGVTSSKWRG